MFESCILLQYSSPPSAKLEITFEKDFSQDTKAIDIFENIVREPDLNDNGDLISQGIMGNLLGLTYAETHSVILDLVRGLDADLKYVDKWLKKGFYSLKGNTRHSKDGLIWSYEK